MKQPTTQTEEVLFTLITERSINKRTMFIDCGISHLGELVRRLRHINGVVINTDMAKTVNKYKRTIKYAKYSIDKKHKESAIKKYELMTKNR